MNRKFLIGRVLLFFVCCALSLIISSAVMKPYQELWLQNIGFAATMLVTLLLTILFVRWENIRLQDVGAMPAKGTLSNLTIGIGIGILMAGGQALIILSSGHVSMRPSGGVTAVDLILHLIMYALLACREELAFRGYPLRTLNYKYGLWISQLIVAIVFAVEHIAGGDSILKSIYGPMVGAILFGMVSIRTGGLAMPIGIHFAWNFGQWCFGFKDNTGPLNAIVEKGFANKVEIYGISGYLFVMSVAIISFYFWRRTPKLKTEP